MSIATPSLRDRMLALVLRPTARPWGWGVVAAVAFIAFEVLLVSQLRRVAPDNAFGAVFLLGVLVISAGWGFPLAVATSLASAFVYVYIHQEGADSLVPAAFVFLPLALLTNVLVGQARLRAAEAEERAREADLSAELARVMLRAAGLRRALNSAGERMASVLALPFVTLHVGITDGSDGELAIPLYDDGAQAGTLLVPGDLSKSSRQRVTRMVPSLEALLAAAQDREGITAALEASRLELERFFAVTSDLLFIGDGAYLTRLNPAFEHVFGYSCEELLATPFVHLIHPDDRQRTENVLGDALRTNGSAQFESRGVRNDDSARWIEWSVVADGGQLFGAARDVTERRREQDRLREAQHQIEASHAAVSALAQQQAALRQVATLVARGAKPSAVYPVAVEELARGLGVNHVTLARYEPDNTVTVLAARDAGRPDWQEGERLSLDGDSVSARILHTGAPARIDDYNGVDGPIAEQLRTFGLRSGVGAPVFVDGQVRGALVVGTGRVEALPPETEAQIGDFADLISTAVANDETRAELKASRARIVTAADQARRRFERDLHDGAQQRIVSVGLELRGVEATLPHEQADVREQLVKAITGLSELYTDLQELSRGIHPAILSKGGLGPAIKTLARRSTVPVALDLDVTRRLPESVEVAAYYVVAESLTNAAKHAQAAEVVVRARADDAGLHLVVSDDGVGGATSGDGSGLIGLKDRVEALAGRLDVASPPGEGTSLTVHIPLDAD